MDDQTYRIWMSIIIAVSAVLVTYILVSGQL